MKLFAGKIKVVELSIDKLDKELKSAFLTLCNDYTFDILRLILPYHNIEIDLKSEERFCVDEKKLIAEIKDFIENHNHSLGVKTVMLPNGQPYGVNPDWSLPQIKKVLSSLGITIPDAGEKIGTCWYVGEKHQRFGCCGIVG